MADAALRRRRASSPAHRTAQTPSPGILPAILAGCIAAFASAGLALDAGGGLPLAALAYGAGGSLALLVCAAIDGLRSSVSLRLPAIPRPQQIAVFARRTHFG